MQTKQSGFFLSQQYLTSDDPQAVYDYYRAELPKHGWEPRKTPGEALRYGYNPLYPTAWGHFLSVWAGKEGDETLVEVQRSEISWKSFATPIPRPVIPEYPGATLVSQPREYPELRRTYVTDDEIDKVWDFFIQELPKNRWLPAEVVKEAQFVRYTYGSGEVEKYHLRIWLSREGDKTQISLFSLHSDR